MPGVRGGFAPCREYAAGPTPSSVTWPDFNGDGRAALLVTNHGTTNFSVLYGDGRGNFAGARLLPDRRAALRRRGRRFNGDGGTDVAVSKLSIRRPLDIFGRDGGVFTPLHKSRREDSARPGGSRFRRRGRRPCGGRLDFSESADSF